MKLALAFALAVTLCACASTPRVTDALGQWRAHKRAAAIATARGEVERFRRGNHIAQGDIDGALAEVDRQLKEETPILLPPPSNAPTPDDSDPRDSDPADPMSPGASIDRGIRQDLAGAGATRTLRAIRVVRRLGLSRFATDLFVIIWRREPWQDDGPLLSGTTIALRSVSVKTAALQALEALP